MARGLGGSGFKAQLLQSPSAVATGAGWSPASQPSMSCAVAYHHFRIRACAGRNPNYMLRLQSADISAFGLRMWQLRSL